MKKPDYIFIFTVAALVVFGLIMLSSASSPIGYEQYGDSYYFLKHQLLFGVLPGLLALFVLSRIDYRIWKKYAIHLLVLSVFLLILVFIPGLGAMVNGSRSWLHFFGMSLQPSEIVKLTFLIYLAAWLEARMSGRRGDAAASFLPFLSILGLIIVLICFQPDVGTMAIIAVMACVVYYAADASLIHLTWMGGIGVALFFFLIKAAPYRMARFTTFLHPELDPQGIGYHINQALLAIGSGGLFGLGLGHSRQKFQYLPEVTRDSVFAVIGEELGFVFSLIFIALLLMFVYRSFKIAREAPDKFGKLLAVGIVTWIIFQSFINIGAMVGILPITGVPLPFVSAGGTAMVVCLAGAGILINISKQARA